jgi:hypothetical protein
MPDSGPVSVAVIGFALLLLPETRQRDIVD